MKCPVCGVDLVMTERRGIEIDCCPKCRGVWPVRGELDKTISYRKLIVLLIIVWTLAVSVARTIRLPNDFSEIHWLLDYRFGFIKRGLIGSLCSFFGSFFGFPITPRIILVLSAVIFCCLCVALVFLLVRSLRRHALSDGAQLMGLVFASSPFIVMSAHLFGYFDALLYLLTIAAVALTLSDRPFIAALFSILGLLTHEGYLLIGFPLVCLASILLLTPEGHRQRWAKHTIAHSIPLVAFLAIIVLQSFGVDETTLRQELRAHLHSFRFVAIRVEHAVDWQTLGLMELLQQQGMRFGSRLFDPKVVASFSPSLLAIVYFFHSSFRIRTLGFLSVVILGAVCSPLAMHAVAWDTMRISTYTIGGAFIAAWILAETRKPQVTNDHFTLLALFSVIINIFLPVPLMDGEVERFSLVIKLLLYTPVLGLLLFRFCRSNASGFMDNLRRRGNKRAFSLLRRS